jgi:hypothetical protein
MATITVSVPADSPYMIAYGAYLQNLVEAVAQLMKEGWVPVGGPFTSGGTGAGWNQAMVKTSFEGTLELLTPLV